MTDESANAPKEIGPYRVLHVLGEGGMGTVYLAEQREPVRRRVAVKVVKLGMDSKRVLARFELERQALASMEHDNIARVFDAGSTDDGRPYFVMERVAGVPITQYCDSARLDVRDRLRLFSRVCDAVQHAHDKGIIHRDLKPSNVLVTLQSDQPVPKIIDFGLARATDLRITEHTVFTEEGQVVGTPEYMSPEQASLGAEEIDRRTDVYSLGVMLYELLVGVLPFPAEQLRRAGLMEMARCIREEDPPRPSTRIHSQEQASPRQCEPHTLLSEISGDLDWVTLKALEKRPSDRYSTAAELGSEVGRFLADEPVLARAPTLTYRLRKALQRHRVRVTVAALLVLASGLGLTVVTMASADPLVAADVERMLLGAERSWAELKFVTARIDHLDEWDGRHQAELRALRERVVEEGDEALGPDTAASVRGRIDVLLTRAARVDQVLRHDVASSAAEHRAAWDAALQDPLVRQVFSQPVPDLVPLGKNTVSDRFEFLHLASGGSGELPKRNAEGSLVITPDTGIVFVLIPGGIATLGSQRDNPDGPNFDPEPEADEPLIEVELEPFLIGAHEVTQAQWKRMTFGDEPSRHGGQAGTDRSQIGGPTHPVESVSWQDASRVLARYGLRLPAETEWEYAARGGRSGRWGGAEPPELGLYANLNDEAVVEHTGRNEAHEKWNDGAVLHAPVGTYRPNGYGLFDVFGNVVEWCANLYTYQGFEYEERVARGGGCRSVAQWARAAARFRFSADTRKHTLGIRATIDAPAMLGQ